MYAYCIIFIQLIYFLHNLSQIKLIKFKNNLVTTYVNLKNMPYSTANRMNRVALMKINKYINTSNNAIGYAK